MTPADSRTSAMEAIASRYECSLHWEFGELSLTVGVRDLYDCLLSLRDDPKLVFEQLIDLCAVDYLQYGEEAGRKRRRERYTVVYHLLSVSLNHRIRVIAWLDDDSLHVPSVVNIWQSANWLEREAFDLFGIMFTDHPDLRRLLTDYGFVGHPFRKDFPISGHVEMRYDEIKKRVVYEPVTIEPRVTVPRVIRDEGHSGRDS